VVDVTPCRALLCRQGFSVNPHLLRIQDVVVVAPGMALAHDDLALWLRGLRRTP
jgi:hypothetical protein